MSEEFDLAEILAQSREYLEENGWAKGEFQLKEYSNDSDDYQVKGYCAMGAVLYSQEIWESECSVDPRTLAVAKALSQVAALEAHDTDRCSSQGCTCVVNWVTAWNDREDTTEQDVLDTFMKAEKMERSGNVE